MYLCTECGISDKHVNNFDEPYFSIEAYDHGAGKNFVGVDGEGAKAPEGFRNFNKKNMISIVSINDNLQ